MAEPATKTSKWAILWTLGILALLGYGLAQGDSWDLLTEAFAQVSPMAVLVTVPVNMIAMLLFAAALCAFRIGVSFWGCLLSRLLRDGADNVVVLFPGFGEMIGARALVYGGARGRAAVMVTVVDRLAEAAAQIPFMILAGIVLFGNWDATIGRAGLGAPSLLSTLTVLAGFAVAIIVVAGLASMKDGPLGRLGAWLRKELRHLLDELHQQKKGIPMALLLHFLAWLTVGVQIWLAAMVLGFDVNLYEAVVMQSAAYSLRLILFFVPAGLAVQEAGFIAAGLLYGIAAPQAVTLSLVLRLRDVIFSLPLLLWPAYEYRHTNGRANAATPH